MSLFHIFLYLFYDALEGLVVYGGSAGLSKHGPQWGGSVD